MGPWASFNWTFYWGDLSFDDFEWSNCLFSYNTAFGPGYDYNFTYSGSRKAWSNMVKQIKKTTTKQPSDMGVPVHWCPLAVRLCACRSLPFLSMPGSSCCLLQSACPVCLWACWELRGEPVEGEQLGRSVCGSRTGNHYQNSTRTHNSGGLWSTPDGLLALYKSAKSRYGDVETCVFCFFFGGGSPAVAPRELLRYSCGFIGWSKIAHWLCCRSTAYPEERGTMTNVFFF